MRMERTEKAAESQTAAKRNCGLHAWRSRVELVGEESRRGREGDRDRGGMRLHLD